MKKILFLAFLSAAMAVCLGALGAHYLKAKVEIGVLTFDNLQSFHTAVHYQLYHSLAIIGVVLLSFHFPSQSLKTAIYLFMSGIVCFSGSIYFLATKNLTGIENLKWLGPITPLGGLLFISGWLLGAFTLLKTMKKN